MLIGLALICFISLFVWAVRTPSRWVLMVQKSSQDGNVEPLLEELDRRPEIFRPKFYDEAMRVLIDTNLEVAIRLTVAVVPSHPESKQSQEWIKVLSIRAPEHPLLPADFLNMFTRSGCSTGAG